MALSDVPSGDSSTATSYWQDVRTRRSTCRLTIESPSRSCWKSPHGAKHGGQVAGNRPEGRILASDREVLPAFTEGIRRARCRPVRRRVPSRRRLGAPAARDGDRPEPAPAMTDFREGCGHIALGRKSRAPSSYERGVFRSRSRSTLARRALRLCVCIVANPARKPLRMSCSGSGFTE